jgi:dihydropyrimidinase
MSLLIQGGRVITATDDYEADVLVRDGRIVAIGRDLGVRADEVIPAAGRYVLPGMVDPHTHFENPFHDTVSCDDFTQGTTSAAFGGTTTVVQFALQQPGQSVRETLAYWHEKLERNKPVVDVGFHVGISDLSRPGDLDVLAELPGEGISSFKMFMAYKREGVGVDDELLFSVMQVAAAAGAIVMVHAENGSVIEVLRRQALARGETAPRYHATTRPPATEGEAVARAITFADLAGAALYVVHVSCAEALDPIAEARMRGLRVWGETCAQYLLTEESGLSRPDGEKFMFTPPPRDPANWDHLWRGLATGGLSVVSSDHSPHHHAQQVEFGKVDFTRIPNGVPGVEDRLFLIHEFGVRGGRFGLRDMVRMLSTAPAQLFGLYPRKGTLAVGSDADIVVFDPEAEHALSAATHHTQTDYNLYEGTRVTGKPEVVLVRGKVVVRGDELVAEPGHGQFVKRAPFPSTRCDGTPAPAGGTR